MEGKKRDKAGLWKEGSKEGRKMFDFFVCVRGGKAMRERKRESERRKKREKYAQTHKKQLTNRQTHKQTQNRIYKQTDTA